MSRRFLPIGSVPLALAAAVLTLAGCGGEASKYSGNWSRDLYGEGEVKMDLASNGGIAHAIDASVYYGLGVSYLDEYPSLVRAVTKEQADAAFAKRVDPDQFTIVSAGSFPS